MRRGARWRRGALRALGRPVLRVSRPVVKNGRAAGANASPLELGGIVDTPSVANRPSRMDEPSTAPGSRAPAWDLGALGLLGVAVSAYLLVTHAQVASGRGAGALCNVSEGLNCTAAALSPWAMLGPVPVAALGLGFYLAVFLLLGVRSAVTQTRAWFVLLFLLSCGYSLFLGVVSVTALDAICPMCVALYVINGLGLWRVIRHAGAGPVTALRSILATPSQSIQRAVLPALVIQLLGTGVSTFVVDVLLGETELPTPDDTRVWSDDLVRRADGPALGPADARLVIVSYSDFQCPHCARLAETLHRATAAYPDDVRIEFRHFPLPFHPDARPAAIAAECAHRQGKFWSMHDAIFSQQRDLEAAALLAMATSTALDVAAWTSCIEDPAVAEIVDADQQAGQAAGVAGTPAFFVNGVRYVGGWPWSSVRPLLRQLLEE